MRRLTADAADRLWVRWVHMYFMKNQDILDYQTSNAYSWILKAVLKCRDKAVNTRSWGLVKNNQKFPTGSICKEIRGEKEKVPWRKLFYTNIARSRALFVGWLACRGRLPTKERLRKFRF